MGAVEVNVELSELVLRYAHACARWHRSDALLDAIELSNLETLLKQYGIDVCFEF